jgi:hypothetical protein
VTIALSLIAVVGFVVALGLGQVPGWQPYPAITTPALNWWPTLCYLLLFTPALQP